MMSEVITSVEFTGYFTIFHCLSANIILSCYGRYSESLILSFKIPSKYPERTGAALQSLKCKPLCHGNT